MSHCIDLATLLDGGLYTLVGACIAQTLLRHIRHFHAVLMMLQQPYSVSTSTLFSPSPVLLCIFVRTIAITLEGALTRVYFATILLPHNKTIGLLVRNP